MNIPHDTTGRSPASPGFLTVFPVIEIRGDWLIWDASGKVKSKPTPRNLLERFCDLNGLDESAILRFARSSGPLGHCKHGSMACCGGWNEVGGPLFADSIEGWRRLSAGVAGLCRVAARVAQRQTSLWSDWLVYPGQCPWPTGQEPWRTVATSRFHLAREVNAWLDAGRVRPQIGWRGNRWDISMGSQLVPTLYGELALQMVLATANLDGFAQCHGCPKAFIPDRRPNPNRNCYCPECRRNRIPQRDAKRDFRRRSTLAKS